MTVDDTDEPRADIPVEAGGDRGGDAPAAVGALRAALVGQWWAYVLRGLRAVALGLAAPVWPGCDGRALVAAFGAYVLVDGIVAVIFSLGGRGNVRWWTAMWGLVSVAAGAAAFLWPDITARALVYLIAAWAVLTGVSELVVAIAWRQE